MKTFETMLKPLWAGLLAAAMAGALTVPANAQSTISLDSFDLPSEEEEADAQALGDCLVGAGAECGDKAETSSKSFSLDDLVSLGIVENEPARVKTRGAVKTRLGIRENPPSPTRDDGSTQTATLAEPERVEPLPSIDVDILFEYDSDRPVASAEPDIRRLGRALSDERFADARFVLMGHTDAKGSASYNQRLSERRAASLRDSLTLVSGLASDRFVVAGRGEADPKFPADPNAAANRRVQVILLDR